MEHSPRANPCSSAPPRLVAFYLPQFHPIPENDAWWGKGFTEWINVAKARPLFPGHYQPHVPADLGFYDLRVPETRKAQADLAQQYGIAAFCYYHYWFAGKRILERPFNEVLASGEPDFPFCLCWANMSWTGVWYGAPNKILIEQTYGGDEDAIRHFHSLLPAFHDRRYLRIDGKPVFLVFQPADLPDSQRLINLWRKLAQENGLPGLHIVGCSWNRNWQHLSDGFDAAVDQCLPPLLEKERKKSPALPTIYRYGDVALQIVPSGIPRSTLYPCVLPNWDNTPRSGANGLVLHDSNPEFFRPQLRKALTWTRNKPDDSGLIFIKAWNEWAEGNYLEPDMRYGHRYLQIIKEELENYRAMGGSSAERTTREFKQA